MWYKIWTVMKFIFFASFGAGILCGIVMTLLGENTFSTVLYCLSCFYWFSYLCNFYYPRKEETKDDEIDFKDL